MNDAFAAVYGRDRSWAGRLFGPIISPRTYLRAVHLLAMFPLGLAYFVALVVSFSVGGALIWTIIGPIVLLTTLYLTRWAGDIEAWLVRHITPLELRRPPTAIERGQSFRSQVWTRLIDPTTWTGIVYLSMQFPIGIAAFVMVLVIGSVSGAFITAPFTPWFFHADLDWGFIELDQTHEAILLVPIGVTALFVGVHLISIASALHASWARLMLGSRAERVPPVAPTPGAPPPVPDGGEPIAAQPAETPSMPEALPKLAAVPEPAAPAPPSTSDPTEAASEEAGETVEGTRISALTPREREVLQLIARGYSNAEIAEAFLISEGTVKTHVKRLLGKLGLRDRTQAAIFAYEVGFITARHDQASLRRVK